MKLKPCPKCRTYRIALAKVRDAIAGFLSSATGDSDNYVGGIEKLQLQSAFELCRELVGKKAGKK